MNKKIFIAVVVAVAVVSVVIVAIFQPEKDPEEPVEDRVAVIYLQGNIAEDAGSPFGYDGITPRNVESQLDRAAKEASVEAVVLRINSPGGSVAASQEIAAMIGDFEKPIVVSMGDMATSGGYYISVPAEGIIANPGTVTGSIGVINVNINLKGLYEKLGIEVDVIKSGEHKDMFHRSLTSEEEQLMQDISNEAYYQFIDEISRGRGLEEEAVKEIATGELFLGSQAKELDLIDRLGGLDEAVNYAGEIAGIERPVKYEFPPPTLLETITRFTADIPELVNRFLTPYDVQILEILEKQPAPDLRYYFPGEDFK